MKLQENFNYGKQNRKKQSNDVFNKWIENFNSNKKAKEWASIIKTEDSPATIALIISSLNECKNR